MAVDASSLGAHYGTNVQTHTPQQLAIRQHAVKVDASSDGHHIIIGRRVSSDGDRRKEHQRE